MNATQKRKLRALKDALDVICSINDSMPVRQAAALLSVALHEASDEYATLDDVGHDTDSPSAVVSRDLLSLGARNRMKKPGYGLVESFADYQDLRRKPYKLTPKGRKIITNIVEAL